MKKQLLTVSLLLLIGVAGFAQQDTAPDANAQEPGAASVEQTQERSSDTNNYVPDTRPISGPEYPTLGTPENSLNVLHSSIRVQESLDSNPSVSGTGLAWQGDTGVYGSLSLNRSWHGNSFTATYDGGGTSYAQQGIESTHFLTLSQVFTLKRWMFGISNRLMYSPETPFGAPGPVPGLFNPLGTQVNLLPNQTILTGRTTQLSNTSVGELEYMLTRRTSLSASASYGLLDYTAAGAPNSNQTGATVGYNYQFAPHDTVALNYGYEELVFENGENSKSYIETAGLDYAHRTAGRISFELGGGAQILESKAAILPTTRNLYPSGHASFTYGWHRSQFTLLASKALMSGAGLFTTADTTLGEIGVSRALSRKWNGSINAGYSENSAAGPTIFGIPQPGANQDIRAGFANVSLQRNVGRYAGLFFMYNFQRQLSNVACSGPLCAETLSRHSVTLGMNWSFRPVMFR